MDRHHDETRGHVGRQRHVQDLMEARGVQHGCDRVDLGEPAVNKLEAGRRVLPRVGRHDEYSGEHAAHRDDHPGQPVQQRRQPVTTVEKHAEEDRLGKKREAFEGKRHPDDRARLRHEARPEQTELERQHGAGDRADREENRHAFCPPLAQFEIHRLARAEPRPLGQHHQQRQPDAQGCEHDVKGQRHGHLRACKEEIIHGRRVWSGPTAFSLIRGAF